MTLPTTPDREAVRANWKRIAAKHAFSHNPEYLNEGSLDALIEFARTTPPAQPARSEGLAEELNILKAARIWLRSALDCKTFLWDSDQHDAASEVCDALNDIVLAATLERELQAAHAALAEAQRTVRNLELANGEARKTIDRLSAMCPQDACNGSAALSSTGEGSGG